MKSLLETGSNTFFVLNSQLQKIALKTTAIDENKVSINRTNKLFGSFGETLVIFHEAGSALGQFIINFQNELLNHFPKAIQNLEAQQFISENNERIGPTSFAPITNLHTTIAALRVIDSYDENSWNNCLMQSYLYAKLTQYQPEMEEIEIIELSKIMLLDNMDLDKVLNTLAPTLSRKILGIEDEATDILHFVKIQCHTSLLSDTVEQSLVAQIQKKPIVELELESISLNTNGSLGIRWKLNEQIMDLRGALSQIGGIAKHGAQVLTTTIGYFPYCSEHCRDEIKQVLQEIISKVESAENCPPKFLLNLTDLQLVQFSRNDLHQNFIKKTLFLDQQHISNMIQQQEFPGKRLSH
ncbi:hypothetical protein DGG96_14660 [Legionella qingyii]|uniref:Uncharacterized protein n=1 Tax=Legionella qingyii TaxID=2184757 RepID=A0A317TZ88_9GAMM|nr:hypothetical protein [Legionella qingyii]PWY54861.1 hypothetical protein DGG96_14660 [Legionella qingyii]RUR20938.1 hypothetical protein ELY20_14130 [Legionella qingyii]RUR23212.1 hypothetical protein ELY16_13535 [Legionella qingyii]